MLARRPLIQGGVHCARRWRPAFCLDNESDASCGSAHSRTAHWGVGCQIPAGRTQRRVKEGAINALHLGPCKLGAGSGIVLAATLALAGGCASGPAHPPAPLTVNAPDVPYTIGP